VLSYLWQYQKQLGFKVIVGGSEGDVSRSVVEPFGFDYIETDNRPISHKNNALMEAARRYDPDGVVIVGSDDLVDINLFRVYQQAIDDGVECLTFTDVYFYSPKYQYLSYLKQTRIGAGRFWGRKALEKMDYKGWSGQQNKGLDNLNIRTMLKKGVEITEASLKDYNAQIIDVKWRENITTENIIFAGERLNLNAMPRGKKKEVDKLEPKKKPVAKGAKPQDLPKNNKGITDNKLVDSSKVEVEFIKDNAAGWSKGQKKKFNKRQAEVLAAKGHVKILK
jgi:hypothetical protein